MPIHAPLSRLLALLLAATLGSRAAALAQGQISVGRNVMVSASSPGWMHAEYAADADPSNPNRVMVCSMRHSQQRNQLASVIYISEDGGKNWSLSLEDTVSRFNGVWDPACSFGLDNQAFLVTLILPDTARNDSLPSYWSHQWWRMGGDNNMHVHRSLDAGKTWEPVRYLSFIDYQTLTIDRTNSRYRGRAYIYGNTSGRGVWLLYSTDSGQTWVRSERNDEDDYYPRDGTILPSGTLLLPMNKRGQAGGPSQPQAISMTVAASRDGGVHIDRSVTIAQIGQCPNPSLGFGMASDHSNGPFRGRAYVVFPNVSRGRCLPFVSWSDDEGKTWSKPVLVSDALARKPSHRPTEHILTKIVVNRDGVIGVTWYDPGDDTTNSHINLRFSASLDGGESWLPSVRVSEFGYVVKHPPEMAAHAIVRGGGVRTGLRQKSDEASVSVLVSARSYYQSNSNPGDYSGMAVGADGAFHTFFVDNRSGNGEMFTSRIMVTGTVANNDAKVAGLTNITSSVELQYVSSVWDPKTASISLEYQLLNTSTDTLEGPVKLRVTSLTSGLGAPILVKDGQVLGGVGTVIDVSSSIPAGGLRPGQTSATQKVQIRIDRLQEYPGYSLANMNVKVFGKKRGGAAPDSTAKK